MAAAPSPTHYDALQLPRGASAEDVRAAYRRLAREHHPDRAGADGQAMARINQAYEVLSDPERRTRYDQQLDTRPPPRKPGRVVLPGDRRRQRLAWAAAGLAIVVVGSLAAVALLRERRPDEGAAARLEPLSLPLPQREAAAAPEPVPAPVPAPAARPAPREEGLRLIPARSIGSVPVAPAR